MTTSSRFTKAATLLSFAALSAVLTLPRDSRGDVAPQYKCATTLPDKPNHVFGTDNRVYCCAVPDPRVMPPQSAAPCTLAPWEKSSSRPGACAGEVTGTIDDTASGNVLDEDENPLEFFLVPNRECNVCSGTSQSALLNAARAKAARFCEKEANFSTGPSKLVRFEPAGSGTRVCDTWKFQCACPLR